MVRQEGRVLEHDAAALAADRDTAPTQTRTLTPAHPARKDEPRLAQGDAGAVDVQDLLVTTLDLRALRGGIVTLDVVDQRRHEGPDGQAITCADTLGRAQPHPVQERSVPRGVLDAPALRLLEQHAVQATDGLVREDHVTVIRASNAGTDGPEAGGEQGSPRGSAAEHHAGHGEHPSTRGASRGCER